MPVASRCLMAQQTFFLFPLESSLFEDLRSVLAWPIDLYSAPWRSQGLVGVVTRKLEHLDFIDEHRDYTMRERERGRESVCVCCGVCGCV